MSFQTSNKNTLVSSLAPASFKLSYFPNSYPGETFHSIICRLFDHMNFPNPRINFSLLKLKGSLGNLSCLASNLEYLMTILPLGHHYTEDRIINQNTLAPFYIPFLSESRAKNLKQVLIKGTSAAVNSLNGRIRRSDFLQFCPLCAEGDVKIYGEKYWHREHQIIGVRVCANHHVFLENSFVQMRSYYQLDKVCSAEQAIRITQVRPIDQSKFSHQIFLKIAQNVNWLLNQHDVELTSELVQRRYQSLLFNKGLTTYLGKLRVKKLLEAIQDYYPGQLLKSLQCEIGESTHSNWVLRTLRPSSAFQNPLYHLLIIFFLGYNISDFLQVSAEIKPFGNSPWPCLNPACQHFLKRVIQKCQVVQNTYGNAKGIFCCNCGFTYSRVGPDRSEEDRFRFISVEEYGRVWDSSLQNMWRNSEITLKEMADFLKVDSQTIKRQATRLELDFPRQSKGVGVLELSTSIKSSKVFSPPSAQEYRSEWLTIRELNPDLGRTALLQQFGRVYSWLYKHDKEWLNEHLPIVRKRDFSSSSNWNEKDAALKISIEEAAKRLKDSIGRPIEPI